MTTYRLRTLALMVPWCCGALLAPQLVGAQAPDSADARLEALYTAEWQWREKEMAREPGDIARGFTADHLPRVDAATQQARLAYWTKVLAELDRIPVAELSPEEHVNAQVFRAVIEELAGDVRFKTYEAPFTADTFFWTSFTPREGFITADE